MGVSRALIPAGFWRSLAFDPKAHLKDESFLTVFRFPLCCGRSLPGVEEGHGLKRVVDFEVADHAQPAALNDHCS